MFSRDVRKYRISGHEIERPPCGGHNYIKNLFN